jgi:hypothetical protein
MIGSGFLTVLLGTRALVAPDPERGVAHARDAEGTGLPVKPTGNEQGTLAVAAPIPAVFSLCGSLPLGRKDVAHPHARLSPGASYDDVSP